MKFRLAKEGLGCAEFSDCERYRYMLWRGWTDGPFASVSRQEVRERTVNFIMLNPSTADESANDPTVERCARRARKMGFDALAVTNIFAWRSTDPHGLRAAFDPIGPENDRILLYWAKRADLVVCGWGGYGSLDGRSGEVLKLLSGIPLHALKLSKAGEPYHPLYVSYSQEPIPFSRAGTGSPHPHSNHTQNLGCIDLLEATAPESSGGRP